MTPHGRPDSDHDRAWLVERRLDEEMLERMRARFAGQTHERARADARRTWHRRLNLGLLERT